MSRRAVGWQLGRYDPPEIFQDSKIKRAQDEIDVLTGYMRDRFFWPEALVEMRAPS